MSNTNTADGKPAGGRSRTPPPVPLCMMAARADSVATRLASCAVAALVAHARRANLKQAVAG